MNRIERVSRVLQFIFKASLVLLPIITVLSWVFYEDLIALGGMQSVNDVALSGLNIPETLPTVSRMLAMAVSMIPMVIDMLTLFFLYKLFGIYAEGRVFTSSSVGYIRRIGITLLIGQALHPVHEALLTLALTFTNPPGQRMIHIGFSSANFSEILIAVMIIVVAWIMDEGRRLSEEQALVI